MVMRYLSVLLCGAFAAISSGLGQAPVDPMDFWEKMVAAKGGRQRLHAISGLVVNRDGQQSAPIDPGRPRGEIHETVVYQFPDRFWNWRDTRPSRQNAYSVSVSNGASRVAWFASGGGASKQHEYYEEDLVAIIHRDQIAYLLETRFVRPVPVSVSITKPGVASVEATAPGFASIRFTVNTNTYLPIDCITSAWVKLPTTKKQVAGTPHVIRIESYGAIDGLQLPSRLRGEVRNVSFAINPAVDQRLFETPPDYVSHRDEWKKYLRK